VVTNASFFDDPYLKIKTVITSLKVPWKAANETKTEIDIDGNKRGLGHIFSMLTCQQVLRMADGQRAKNCVQHFIRALLNGRPNSPLPLTKRKSFAKDRKYFASLHDLFSSGGSKGVPKSQASFDWLSQGPGDQKEPKESPSQKVFC